VELTTKKSTQDVFHVERNPLAGLPALKGRVAVYVPTTQGGGPATAQVVQYQKEKVAEALSRYFGGFTIIEGEGGWYSETQGKLIRERVWIVYAGCDQAVLTRCLASVVRLAGQVARAMAQECVTLEVNGTLYFVPQTAAEMVP